MQRRPFFTACPLCDEPRSAEVVTFEELSFHRCPTCTLVYKREQREGLSGEGLSGGGYDEAYFRKNRAGYLKRWAHRVRKCRRQILACLEYAPHAASLLDVGCSAGYVLEAARSLGLEPAGLDISEFAVGLCRERGYRAEVGSLSKMPFADASFDVVTLKHTLEHVESPLGALREVRRVLKPGGVAFVIVPDVAYWKIALMPRRGRSFRPDRRGWQHHVYFGEATLAQAAEKAGLVPAKAGKAILRRRLAQGPRAAWEWLRYAFLLAWTGLTRRTRTRREIQLIARRAPSSAT